MRRTKWVELVVIGLLAGAIATLCAILIPWLPTAASRQAGRITFVYWFATVICLFIFAVVMAILDLRDDQLPGRSPGDWSDGPPVHGHTTIEIVWTVIPAVLVTSISIVERDRPDPERQRRHEPARRQGDRAAVRLAVPVPERARPTRSCGCPSTGRSSCEITATDVIHSFWVPEFAQKQDAVPGQVNDPRHHADKVNDASTVHPVICTELCGLGHSLDAQHDDRDDAGRIRQLVPRHRRRPRRSRAAAAGRSAR